MIKNLANNYAILPNKIFKKAFGIHLIDSIDRKYIDGIAGYSAVNQGHCHPRIINRMIDSAKNMTLTSRFIVNESIVNYSNFMTEKFNFNSILPMNTGVEAAETSIKIARKYAYERMNIPQNEGVILVPKNNFWGRTITAISSSDDNVARNNFGPYTPGFKLIDYNNIEALEHEFKFNPNIIGFYTEPIQGEGGINIPDDFYFYHVRRLCDKYNKLLILDEIQTGLGRTGKMFCYEHYNIQPDILVIGKALSGGTMPISAVMTKKDIMSVITPGCHGSTFGGNPLACDVAMESIKVIIEENMINNSYRMGNYIRNELNLYKENIDGLVDIRGKGLMNGFEFIDDESMNKFIYKLLNKNIIVKGTRNNTVRFSPPLTIKKDELDIVLQACID